VHADFVADFALFRLHKTLTELGCDAPAIDKLIAWYWSNAPSWSASSQAEFDAAARDHLKTEWTTRSLRAGASKSIPSHFRSDKFLGYSKTGREIVSTTDFVRDAVQDGWVQLLEDAARDGQANGLGRSAGRDLVREQRRYVLLPQDRVDETGDSTTTAPWDEIDSSDYYRANFADDVRRALISAKHDQQRGVLLQLRDERPDDYEFLISYLAGRRKGRFTRQERNRAGSIIERLRRAAAKWVN
jgi:hypothetical protein